MPVAFPRMAVERATHEGKLQDSPLETLLPRVDAVRGENRVGQQAVTFGPRVEAVEVETEEMDFGETDGIVFAAGDAATWSGMFSYDPTQGNLLIDIQNSGTQEAASNWSALGADPPRGVTSRLWQAPGGGPNGITNSDCCLVTRFTFEAASGVPEPATVWLVGLGVAGICVARRRDAREWSPSAVCWPQAVPELR